MGYYQNCKGFAVVFQYFVSFIDSLPSISFPCFKNASYIRYSSFFSRGTPFLKTNQKNPDPDPDPEPSILGDTDDLLDLFLFAISHKYVYYHRTRFPVSHICSYFHRVLRY